MLLLCLSAAGWLAAMRDATSIAPYGTRWIARMGQWSYEIYLSHMFVVLTVTAIYQKIFDTDMQWTFVAYVPAIAICVWLGGWLHRRVSGPAATWISARTFSATKKGAAM